MPLLIKNRFLDLILSHNLIACCTRETKTFPFLISALVFSNNIQQHLNFPCDVSCDNKGLKEQRKKFSFPFLDFCVFCSTSHLRLLPDDTEWKSFLVIFFILLIRIFFLTVKEFYVHFNKFRESACWSGFERKRDISEWKFLCLIRLKVSLSLVFS